MCCLVESLRGWYAGLSWLPSRARGMVCGDILVDFQQPKVYKYEVFGPELCGVAPPTDVYVNPLHLHVHSRKLEHHCQTIGVEGISALFIPIP